MLMGTAIYVSLFIITVALFALWQAKRRRVRAPLDFRLLRGPGESLRRRLAAYDENMIFRVGGAAIVPLVATLPVLFLFTRFKPTTWSQVFVWLGVLIGVFGIAIWLSFRWAVRDFLRYRDIRLGYLGERAVGDALLPVIEAGYKVFHDVPAEVNEMTFNVDHVAIGPGGVFAIETKTRRKGRARTGFEEHKVAYDGRQLIWPWGEDTFGLENAQNRARWLSDWLNKMTGFGIAAQPVLVLPGWYVVPKGLGPVTVVNHKQLAGAILRERREALTAEQVGLIARQLDERCRDVQD